MAASAVVFVNGVISMNATYIMQAVQHLKSNILLHVRHRALLQHTGEPILDENQLFFILLPQLNGDQVGANFEMNATTVGIVHASLMEHDKIKEQNATSKEQQLTVLSGDYYSGRYYLLLAHLGNIELINLLSKGIVERCEQEMTVYEQNDRTLTQWVHSLVVIEARLITQFYTAMGLSKYAPLAELSLTICRLQRELQLVQKGNPTHFGNAMQAVEANVAKFIEERIAEKKEQLKTLLQTTSLDEQLKQYIETIVA